MTSIRKQKAASVLRRVAMAKVQGYRIVFQKTSCGEACVSRKLQGSMDENAFGAGKWFSVSWTLPE
jgi:hypothetical protein